MAEAASLRDRLRQVPTVSAVFPYFDTDAAPTDPMPLIIEWIETAIDGGVLQPLAMTVATASTSGQPSARTLIVKDVDATSLWFASLDSGAKGAELAENPRAALVFYWREQGRQIRVVGRAEPGPREVSRVDFLARTPNARARALAGRQGEPIADLDERLAAARTKIDSEPDYVPENWVAYRVIPETVEFWQAERERDQVRLRYLRDGSGWVKDILWP
ncbi:MAG TPA: pyridoxal 5'-phosphate synthase [Galbitalea sp.]|jgi:pyridoxamine 5'-phosphate oxidase|nr:pyridoxal 5'-phosphate synthase [Galbitalea sp.]